MHVEDTCRAVGSYANLRHLLLLLVSRCQFEAHLLGVEEVPVLVDVIVIRVEPLLAQVAEVVLGNMTFGAIIQDEVLFQAALTASCLT